MKKIKQLGQHFLHDKNFLKKIAALVEAESHQTILEIGPGSGNLTRFLLEKNRPVTCVEIDTRWATAIRHQYSGQAFFSVINTDVLELDWSTVSDSDNGIVAVGNLPYQITSPILFQLLENRRLVTSAVFMMQREVAERVAAGAGTKVYGILSVLLQHFFEVKLEFHVPAGAFSPHPQVTSSVLTLNKKAPAPVLPTDWAGYSQFVKRAFNQRRKMLRNTLKNYINQSAPVSEFTRSMMDKRPEQLTPEEFVQLYEDIRQRRTA